jgi:hypothetical protein
MPLKYQCQIRSKQECTVIDEVSAHSGQSVPFLIHALPSSTVKIKKSENDIRSSFVQLHLEFGSLHFRQHVQVNNC